MKQFRGVESGDDKDCAVRALANSTGMHYEEAFAILEEAGRGEGEGTCPRMLNAVLKENGFKLIGAFKGNPEYVPMSSLLGVRGKPRMSIKKALETFSEGVFIMAREGHVFAVEDGYIIDGVKNDMEADVVAVWQLEE